MSDRTRVFATIVYPESCPENLFSIISEMFVPCIVSPLHNKDVHQDTGELKKPHYHVLFIFDGVKSDKQINEVVKQICGVGIIKVKSVKAYARYLCHLDNEDKYQYDISDVKTFGGAEYTQYINTTLDKYNLIIDIMNYIDENDVRSYRDLLRYCRTKKLEWFYLICESHSHIILEYIKSATWTDKIKKYAE